MPDFDSVEYLRTFTKYGSYTYACVYIRTPCIVLSLEPHRARCPRLPAGALRQLPVEYPEALLR